jgi:hypothetical protein
MTDINTYTAAEIANLTPQSGDLVLNTDDNAVQLWNGSAWKIFNSDVSPFPQDYSVSLDGTDDHVLYNSTSGNQTALGSFTGDMSFCFWVKLSSGSDIMSTHSTYNSSGASGTLDAVRTGTGRIQIFSYSNGISAYTSPNYLESSKSADQVPPGRGLSLNQWTFIAVTVDTTAQEHKLYTATESDSPSLEATHSSASHALTDFANGFKLGEARGTAGGGLFDEFAIFDGKALSANEVAKIWNNGEAFDYDTDGSLNPVGWYRMGDNDLGAGTSVTNAGSAGSGSAFDAELTNDASFVSGSGNTPGN